MNASVLIRHGPFLLFALVAGILYYSTLDTHGSFMWDEAEYASIGRSVTQGEGFAINDKPNRLRPPLLPLSGAAVILTTGSTGDTTLKLAVLFYALVALGILYHALSIAHDQATGLFGAVFLGFSPAMWGHTSLFLSEVPFLAFFAGAVLYFHLGLFRNPRFFYGSWMCWGLALLTRYTAVLFGPIALLMLAGAWGLTSYRKEIWSRIRTPAFILAPLLGFAIVLPWLIRQYATFGDPLTGFKIASRQLQVYMPRVSMPWHFYLGHLPEMITWLGTILLALALIRIIWKKHLLGMTALLVAVFLMVWFSVYRYKEVRLITSILPFLAVLAAVGGMDVLRTMCPKVDSRIWWVALALLMGPWAYLQTRPYFETNIALGYPVLTEAASFIEQNTPEDAVIMGSIGPQLFWYTNRSTRGIPKKEEFQERLSEVDWIMIVNFERGQPAWVAELMALFTVDDLTNGVMHEFRSPQFVAYVISADEVARRWKPDP